MKKVNFEISDEHNERARIIAIVKGQTKNEVLRCILETAINEQYEQLNLNQTTKENNNDI